MALAISTSWNASVQSNTKKLLFEIAGLGFKKIELSFNLGPEMTSQIFSLSRKLKIDIGSVHNYCPVPDGISRQLALPDCYSLASSDSQQRSLAIKFTKRTIETCARVGAKAVVLHCGKVEIEDSTRKLINLYNQGLNNSEVFINLKEEMIRQRDLESKDSLDYVLASLDQLNKHAEKYKVLLGIETRFYHSEIPDINELGVILQKFSNSQIYYWHDTGHAQLMENLGFAKHRDFLNLYGSSLIGIHLHDIIGCQDHLAPLKGELDFTMFKPYLKKDTLKVIEAHQPASAQDLIKSFKYLSEIYDGAD